MRSCPTMPSCMTVDHQAHDAGGDPRRGWHLRPGELLWDVGSGSGSIAVQWCLGASGCRAVAFENNPERRERIATNARRFGADIEVRGQAPHDFDGAARPAAIFVGGGVTRPGLLDACLDRLRAGGRLVANAVTAESEAALVDWHSRLGGELFRFQHYRGEPLGAASPGGDRRCRSPSGW